MNAGVSVNAIAVIAGASISFVCTNPHAGGLAPVAGLSLIGIALIVMNQLIRNKSVILAYVCSETGVVCGLIARVVYDLRYQLYDHNLFPIEIAVLTAASSIALAAFYATDRILARMRGI